MADTQNYSPRGRTDESSYDYTDHPASLAASFGLDRLERALAYAIEDDGPEPTSVMLKFDYEEYVPVAAVREAIVIARQNRRGF